MGELINLNALKESDIPADIARDTEVTAAINSHLAATDPHTQYLLQSEGDARYRQISVALIDSDIPASIARDTEVTAAINSHLAATDPHTQYLRQSEGDVLYRSASQFAVIFTSAALPKAVTAGNSFALGWNSIQPGQGIAELCNYAGNGGGDAFNFFRMPGAADALPTLSQRVARIDINGAYIQVSDGRLKKFVAESPGLTAILALKPKKYRHYAVEAFDDEKRAFKLGSHFKNKIGFIAQEVREVLPESVSSTESDAELYGIDYSCILGCAVRAIQEQHQEIEILKKEIEKLRAEGNFEQ